ncbi:MAG TPA: redoxin family protein, partial [Stellaceae bacterium]|nr:redoxin family protein [Stellaceae bacterium]
PCRVEHPLLMRLAAEKEVPVYGIAYKDKPEDTAQFLEQLGDPYLGIGLDRSGRTAIDFGVYGVPETYLLDQDGHIRYRFAGALSVEVFEHEIMPRIKALKGSS